MGSVGFYSVTALSFFGVECKYIINNFWTVRFRNNLKSTHLSRCWWRIFSNFLQTSFPLYKIPLYLLFNPNLRQRATLPPSAALAASTWLRLGHNSPMPEFSSVSGSSKFLQNMCLQEEKKQTLGDVAGLKVEAALAARRIHQIVLL